MKIENLRIIMEKSGVSSFGYSLNNTLKEDAYHIINEDDTWSVFYIERGKKNVYGIFSTEEEACQCFYEIVQKHLEI